MKSSFLSYTNYFTSTNSILKFNSFPAISWLASNVIFFSSLADTAIFYLTDFPGCHCPSYCNNLSASSIWQVFHKNAIISLKQKIWKAVTDMAMFLNTPLPYKRYKKISETTYFVDKSLILNDIFGCMEEETQYICITRPRRFGKTIMANMLGAFFGKAWDASQIFDHWMWWLLKKEHTRLNLLPTNPTCREILNQPSLSAPL